MEVKGSIKEKAIEGGNFYVKIKIEGRAEDVKKVLEAYYK